MAAAKPLDKLQAFVERAANSPGESAAAGLGRTASDVYNPRFRPAERQDVHTSATAGIAHEIAMLRALIRRVFEATDEMDMDLGGLCEALDALGAGAARLAALLRSEQEGVGDGDELAESGITQGVSEVIEEIGLK